MRRLENGMQWNNGIHHSNIGQNGSGNGSRFIAQTPLLSDGVCVMLFFLRYGSSYFDSIYLPLGKILIKCKLLYFNNIVF
jgi:hypothetical protein